MAVSNVGTTTVVKYLESYWEDDDVVRTTIPDSEANPLVYSPDYHGSIIDFRRHKDFAEFRDSYIHDVERLEALAIEHAKFSTTQIKRIITEFTANLFQKGHYTIVGGIELIVYRTYAYVTPRQDLHCALWCLEHDPSVTVEQKRKVLTEMIDGLDSCIGRVQNNMAEAVASLRQEQKGAYGQIQKAKMDIAEQTARRFVQQQCITGITRSNRGCYEYFGRLYEVHTRNYLLSTVSTNYGLRNIEEQGLRYVRNRMSHSVMSEFNSQFCRALTYPVIIEYFVTQYQSDFMVIYQKYHGPFTDDGDLDVANLKDDTREEIVTALNMKLMPSLRALVCNPNFGLTDLLSCTEQGGPLSRRQLECNLTVALILGMNLVVFKNEYENVHKIKCLPHCGNTLKFSIVTFYDFVWFEKNDVPEFPQFEHLSAIGPTPSSNAVKRKLLLDVFSARKSQNSELFNTRIKLLIQFLERFNNVEEFKILCSERICIEINKHLFHCDSEMESDAISQSSSFLLKCILEVEQNRKLVVLNILKTLFEYHILEYDNFKSNEHLYPVLDELIKQSLLMNQPLSQVELKRLHKLLVPDNKLETTQCEWLANIDWQKAITANKEQLLGLAVLSRNSKLFGMVLVHTSPNIIAKFWSSYRATNPKRSLLRHSFYDWNCFELLMRRTELDVNQYFSDQKQTALQYAITFPEDKWVCKFLEKGDVDVFVFDENETTALQNIVDKFGISVLNDWFELQRTLNSTNSIKHESIDDFEIVDFSDHPISKVFNLIKTSSELEEVYPSLCDFLKKEDQKFEKVAAILFELWWRYHLKTEKDALKNAIEYLKGLEERGKTINLTVVACINKKIELYEPPSDLS